MEGKTFKTPASLEGVSTLKDGSLSLRFYTQELSAEQKTEILNTAQSFGWLVFSESENTDIPEEEVRRDIGGKTPSQRLRAVLFVLYQQSGQIDITFEQFYAQKMNALIKQLKTKLEDK